ncbi:MAG: sigma-70 family RNA polymerase sigma factor [Deltaproteobacteria bacterium]|nr:sigma-70 family RNA polymerase sigma factor [Deltaproteobacteria bacterium]
MWIFFSALLTGRPPGHEDDPGEAEIQRLVQAAASGDEVAANRLYSLFVARVFRTVRPLCVGEAEAEDVTQETFVRLLSALPRYRPREGVRFVSYLLTIALNLARNRARRRRTLPTDPAELGELREGEGGARPDEGAERRQAVERLLAAMEQLSERDRQVVSLRYGAGLEAAEVAGLLGLQTANVRKICERARARLLEQLGLGAPGEPVEEGAPA